jgi:flagellar assembly protein FliH
MSCKVLPRESEADSPLVWRPAPREQPEPQPEDAGVNLAQVEADCEQRCREAYAAGLREGESTARKNAAAEVRAGVERLARSVEELAGMRARLRHEAEEDLVELAIAIARRILRREVAVDPEALRGIAMAALARLQPRDLCRVRVHPSHAAALSSCLQDAAGGARIEVIPDAAREPGTLIFETERGNLDASTESQLAEIERGLADRLGRRR